MLRESYNHAQRLVDKLKEAKAAQDALLGVAQAARVEGDPYNDGTQYEEWRRSVEDRANAQQKLNEINDRALGINKAFLEELSAYHEGLRTGVLDLDAYTKKIVDLDARRHASSDAGKAEAKAAREAAKGLKEVKTPSNPSSRAWRPRRPLSVLR